jgi:hypothetical protein
MREQLWGILAKCLAVLLWVYLIGLALAMPYFNWVYATTHGFTKWLFFGEVVATFRAVAWPYHLLLRMPTPQPSGSQGGPQLTRKEVRRLLRESTERANREIALTPFSIEDCPELGDWEVCLEPFEVELRSDLQVNQHYRVHFPSVDLDENREAREAWATLVGGDDSSTGFWQESEQACTGQTLQLMKERGLRIGIFHYTPNGTLITSGIIDWHACQDFIGLADEVAE